MALQPYASPVQRTWYYAFRVICGLILFFLIFPILVIPSSASWRCGRRCGWR